jgi:hypothetical protein
MAMYSSPASRAAAAIVRRSSLQRLGLRGLDLAPHLAQLRWNPVEAERGIDVLLALAGHLHVVRGPEQSILVQLEALADRAIAQRDVVRLRSGEVLHRGAAAVGRDEPEVGLKSALDEHARLRVAVSEHALDEAVLHEVVHQRWRRSRGEQVQVAAGVAPPPQAADRLDRRVRRARSQICDQRGGRLVGIRQQVTSRETLALFERLEDQRLLLGAHAAERANAAVERGTLQVIQGADVELTVQGRHRLWPDTLQMQQVEDRGRELGDQLPVERGIAGVRDLVDARGEIFADAGNLPQSGFVEARQLVRMVGGDVGAVSVRTNLERVVSLDFEEISDLPKDARDREVIQAGDLRSRNGSPAAARRPPRALRQSRIVSPPDRSRTGIRRRPRRRPCRRSRLRLSRALSGRRSSAS